MGTHPIFESDFDCLTGSQNRQIRDCRAFKRMSSRKVMAIQARRKKKNNTKKKDKKSSKKEKRDHHSEKKDEKHTDDTHNEYSDRSDDESHPGDEVDPEEILGSDDDEQESPKDYCKG